MFSRSFSRGVAKESPDRGTYYCVCCKRGDMHFYPFTGRAVLVEAQDVMLLYTLENEAYFMLVYKDIFVICGAS